MRKKYFIILFFFFLLSSYTIGAKEYTDNHGISLIVPESWEIYSKEESSKLHRTDIYGDFITIILYNMAVDSNSSPKILALSNQSVQELGNSLFNKYIAPRFDSVLKKSISKIYLANVPAMKISVSGYQNGYLVTNDSYFIEKNKKFIIIDVFSPMYRPDIIEEVILKMLDSLSIY